MNLRTIRTIFFKETLDTLRDKRTLVAMLGLPIVLYPALFIFGSQAAIVQQDKVDKGVSRVAVVGDDPDAAAWVHAMPQIEVADSTDPATDLAAGRIDAVVRIDGRAGAGQKESGSLPIRIEYDATESVSREAQQRLHDGFEKQFDRILQERLKARGLPDSFAQPLKLEIKNVATSEKSVGSILGMVLPVLMVLMVGIGAFYPAIDITAGEKERGTFETLLSTPTSKFEIVFGKFLTVYVLSMLSGLLNLGSVLLTFAFQLAQLKNTIGTFEIHFPPQTVLLILLLHLPLAFLISAAMMSIAVLARSFKEAQNFLTPFLGLMIFPSFLCALPGVKLSLATQLIPIANVSLLFKSLLTGEASVESVFAVLVSTVLYAVLALLFATWVFQREEVILSEDHGIPLTWRRKDIRTRSAPTPSLALVLFCLVLVLVFYVGSYVQSRSAMPGLLFTQWALILLPTLGLLWFVRVDLVNALSLRLPTTAALAGALLIGFGWVFIIVQITVWQNRVFPMPQELVQEMEKMLHLSDPHVGVAGILFAFALSPAICEESLFRGALLSGFRQKMPAWASILFVGLLFGVLHISVYRILLTGLSGIVLTYLVWRSGSLLTSMLAHFLLNALPLLAATNRLPEILVRLLADERVESEGIPWPVLAGAVGIVAAGVVLVEWSARTRHDKMALDRGC